MGNVENKLSYLSQTKSLIKNAIIAKGQLVADTDTFRSYADKIGQISGGVIDFVDGFTPTYGTEGGGKIIVKDNVLDCSATGGNPSFPIKQVSWFYLRSWELAITFSGLRPGNHDVCLFGTNMPNYYSKNPSAEIPNPTTIWIAWSNNQTSGWGSTYINLEEEMIAEKTYKVIYGWDGQKIYGICKNISDKIVIGSVEVPYTNKAHTEDYPNYELCFFR